MKGSEVTESIQGLPVSLFLASHL